MEPTFLSIAEIVEIIRAKEFTEEALRLKAKPGMIEATLRTAHKAVRATASQGRPVDDLFFDVPGYVGAMRELASHRIHLQYNSESDKFRIKSLTSTLPDVKKVYLVARNSSLPPVSTINKDLLFERVNGAALILNNISNRSKEVKSYHL